MIHHVPETDLVSVRHMVDDVEEALDFYIRHLGFTLHLSAPPQRHRDRTRRKTDPPTGNRR